MEVEVYNSACGYGKTIKMLELCREARDRWQEVLIWTRDNRYYTIKEYEDKWLKNR